MNNGLDSRSTQQLLLTRLWYLTGNWEGTGKGSDFRFRARANFAWTLSDHFLAGHLEISDFGSGQLLSAEHSYFYYDRDLNCLAGDFFGQDGMVEHAVGHADARGRMVLTTDRLGCIPKGVTIRRWRRTIWSMATAQWAFTQEADWGQGLGPYLEGQMRRRG